MAESESERATSIVADADYRADDLADKLEGWLVCRPERTSREEALIALHEWLKSQLVLMGK